MTDYQELGSRVGAWLYDRIIDPFWPHNSADGTKWVPIETMPAWYRVRRDVARKAERICWRIGTWLAYHLD